MPITYPMITSLVMAAARAARCALTRSKKSNTPRRKQQGQSKHRLESAIQRTVETRWLMVVTRRRLIGHNVTLFWNFEIPALFLNGKCSARVERVRDERVVPLGRLTFQIPFVLFEMRASNAPWRLLFCCVQGADREHEIFYTFETSERPIIGIQ